MKRGENLVRPPRELPSSLKIQVLLGGALSQIGWGLFGFGMIFVWVFGSSPLEWFAFSGELGQVTTTVTRAEETSAEVNEEDVVVYYYSYEVDGSSFDGRSYSTGWRWDEGDTVTVEFPVGNPGTSRLKGARPTMFPPFATLIVVIFPGIGLLMMYSAMRGGLKGLSLLRNGELAYGRLLSKEPTGVTINDQPQYAMTFEFTPEGRHTRETVVCKTIEPHELEDEEEEPLLYLPTSPSYAVLLDGLPGSPYIDSRGQFRSSKAGFSVCIIPALALGFNALMLAVRTLL